MAARIFLNYRRDDADAWADRLHERLVERFGDENIFLDVDGRIPIGMDFVDFLGAQVASCEAMVAVIGRRWLEEIEARAASGEPDFVKIEIEAALARDIPVAPALVGGATMPSALALPESLRPLARRHALAIGRGPEFEPAINRLITGLEAAIALSKGDPTPLAAPPLSRDAGLAASPAGTIFRDRLQSGGEGPEICVIPAGRFVMGSPEDEPERREFEDPQHEVRFARAFGLGRFAVTRGEFAAFVSATGHDMSGGIFWFDGKKWKPDASKSWLDPGFAQNDRHPVVGVSWEDAQGYCRWLSEQTGQEYRLPSEAEREYACRAGTATPFWWGREITPDQANYNGNFVYEGGGAKGVYRNKTEPVDAFQPNPWGLYQTHGNVLEWCQDAWNATYAGAPSDGSAWASWDIYMAVLRGGSWDDGPRNLRSASRDWNQRADRSNDVGFRVARTLVDD